MEIRPGDLSNHLEVIMTQLVRGSLDDMARNSKSALSKVFLECEALILIDVSGSMDARDCGTRTRYEVAVDQLIALQRDQPGKIGVIAWNHDTGFCPSGIPTGPSGGTDLVKALTFIKPADGCGMRFIVISDGSPDDPNAALSLAAGFLTKLDTVFCGPEGKEGDTGRKFMKELARVSGGIAVTQSVKDLGLLNQTVSRLLKA